MKRSLLCCPESRALGRGRLAVDRNRKIGDSGTAAAVAEARRLWADRARAPHGHWKTTTFIAGLRHDRIDAPMVLDRPINGRAFRAYVEHFLAPTLQPADIVSADNLASYKVARGARRSRHAARR